jgi:hypothetical protein
MCWDLLMHAGGPERFRGCIAGGPERLLELYVKAAEKVGQALDSWPQRAKAGQEEKEEKRESD